MQVYWPRKNRSFGTIDALGLVGLVGLLVARFIPVAKLIPFWGCTFRKLTGWPCPGCGLTRVADRFAHFHWLGAFTANPLGFVAALLFAVALVASVAHLTLAVPLPEFVLSEREWRVVRWSVGVLVLVNYCFVAYAHRVLHWT